MCTLLLAMHFKMWVAFSGVSSLFLDRKEEEMEPLWSLSVSLSLSLTFYFCLFLVCMSICACTHVCLCVHRNGCVHRCLQVHLHCVCVSVCVCEVRCQQQVSTSTIITLFSETIPRVYRFTSNEQSLSCKILLSLTSRAGITDTCVCVQLLLEPRSPYWDHRHMLLCDFWCWDHKHVLLCPALTRTWFLTLV